MRQIMAFSAYFTITLCFSGSVFAAGYQDRASSLDEVARCRSITTDAARLACFDRAVAALDAAERTGEVVVLDRAQVRETNRQLFGFEIVNPFAGRPNLDQEPALDSIETTLAAATISSEGKWIFRLADKSEWRQIDSGDVRFRNRAGENVRVRRASLGSYMLTIGNSRAVRVRRQ
ncbi:hypothetical protein [Brevundimonas sp. SL130]|uniref:hypothetical protein n=1 Tax=Brevundimonas sp. SL130 TaxID=2995143 RepID=UPI00226C708E|nr:hypothetical protein [Brevundimonas sp. SL130]WAC58450.1 hypothetical protein OU998_09385 [Brevundimonas sp. SL130]